MSHINPHIDKALTHKTLSIKALQYYLDGISSGDRYILAETITLLESNNIQHQKIAYDVLALLPQQKIISRRIGITGSPGTGKSTFIESIGKHLLEANRKVAVLTIDPSSALTHGSILGDKTRMLELAKSPYFFIRPSPSSTHLGGIHQHTYEAICLCEAAGYDDIIIETVGVGQSEIEIRNYVDLMILLLLPGGGDSLQGIKKGIMETTDIIVVNKADGERKKLASEMSKNIKDAQHSLATTAIPVYEYSSIAPEQQSILPKINEYFIGIENLPEKRKGQENQWLKKRLLQDIFEKIDKCISSQLKEEESRKQITGDSVFKEYLRVSKSIDISVSLK